MKTPQMDLKSFGEKDFDPKNWINQAWSSSGNQEKEVFVANAVSRLQLYMKQLTNSLDETTTKVVTYLPKIIQEATALQADGSVLQQQLTALQQKVQNVEAQTGSSIQSLQRIDKLKSLLENAASTLQEADKWAALTTTLEELLETGVPTQGEALTDLAAQITSMTQSLEALSDAPDYDRKKLQLETIYNRLEASLSPALTMQALTQLDSDQTAAYVAVFLGMGRMTSLCQYWRRGAASRLLAMWQRVDGHSLPVLSRLLTTEAPKQLELLGRVVKASRPLAELLRLYTDVLLSLEPSTTMLASAEFKIVSTAVQGVDLLTRLRQDLDDLVVSIKNIIDAQRPTESVPSETVREFGLAAYAPLREHLPRYTEYQSQLLLQHLNDPVLKQEDILEYARGVLSLAERCDSWLLSAYNRGRQIAGVAISVYHSPAVESFLKAFTSHIAAHSRRIETEFLTSVSGGQAAGVLSDTFPAALTTQAAAAALLDILAARHRADTDEEVPAPKPHAPLEDLPLMLLEPEVRQRLSSARVEPLPSIGSLRRTKEYLLTLAKSILRQPVDTQLERIALLPVWSDNDALTTDLPDFALSPQEYITEIGQYLMTLPQHLEMHLSEKQAPWQFLTDVCVHTCNIYAEKILSIKVMDELGRKRCLTDITYLASVVEDLGSNITPSLKSLETSLRAATPGHV